MNPVIILEFETKESMKCFVDQRKLNVIETGNNLAIVESENTTDLAIKLSTEIGPVNVMLAFKFKNLKSIFEEYLTLSRIKSPADFRVIPLRMDEEQIELYYDLVEEAINILPGLEISEVEPRAIYSVFIGKSVYLEIWSSNGIGGNACISNETIGILFTGSRDSFNITINAIRSGFRVKLYHPYINDENLRKSIYLVWRLAKIGNITLVVYRENGSPSIGGLAELLSTPNQIKYIILPCKAANKIKPAKLFKTIEPTGITPLLLGCLEEVKEFELEDISSKFSDEISLSDENNNKPVWKEIQANSSNMGLHIMLDSIVANLNLN
ncbi:MAG: hypothetical protein ACP5NC_03635 [Nitrososphaeria archaeon]